jgi:hypothetical protein
MTDVSIMIDDVTSKQSLNEEIETDHETLSEISNQAGGDYIYYLMAGGAGSNLLYCPTEY